MNSELVECSVSLTLKQWYMRKDNGTPEDYADAIMKAEAAGIISLSEAHCRIKDYEASWKQAGE